MAKQPVVVRMRIEGSEPPRYVEGCSLGSNVIVAHANGVDVYLPCGVVDSEQTYRLVGTEPRA